MCVVPFPGGARTGSAQCFAARVIGTAATSTFRPGVGRDVLANLGLQVLLRYQGATLVRPSDGSRCAAFFHGIHTLPTPAHATALAERLHCDVAWCLRLMVNVVPRKRYYMLATFEDLQEAAQGVKRLGVLRMDVDNLGYLFGQGFVRKHEGAQGSHATLSRVGQPKFCTRPLF